MALQDIHDANVRAYQVATEMQQMKARLAELDQAQAAVRSPERSRVVVGSSIVVRRSCLNTYV